MSASHLPSRRRALAATASAAVLALALAACGSSENSSDSSMAGMPGMSHGAAHSPTAGAMPSMSGMDGMDGTQATQGRDGLAAEKFGYRLTAATAKLPAGAATAYRFTITGPDGKPVTGFTVNQTKKLHFYAIRSDLTGFQHLHPDMAADGTWTAPLDALTPGNWRLFAAFMPDSGRGKGVEFVLSTTATVPGDAATTTLPAASDTATVDGYTVTVKGEPMATMMHPLTATITRDGKPVTDLQPYLDTYAHLTAFHAGDQAFAHVHPTTGAKGDHGGPELTFQARLARTGDWRLFLQFRTGGQLHTAALTLRVK